MVCFVSAIDDPCMAFTIRHRRTDEKLELLAQLPPFRAWRRARITDLGRNAELCTVPAGTRLQAQGVRVSQWICVVRGVAVRTVDGEPFALLPAGSCWGGPLLTEAGARPSPEAVFALERTTVVVVDRRRWVPVAAADPVLAALGVPAPDERDLPAGAEPQAGGAPPRKNRSNSPSTPAPCSVIPPSTTTV